MNGRVTQKVLLIVCVPLISGLVFLGSLWFLLSEAEKTGAQEQRVREALDRCNEVNRKVLFLAAAVSFYAQNPEGRSSELFDKTEKSLKEDLQLLQASCIGNPKAMTSVQRTEQVCAKCVKYGREMLQIIYLGEGLAPMRMLELKQHIGESVTEIRESYTTFRKAMLAELRHGPHSFKAYREQTKALIIFGIIGSVIVSLIMVRLLSKEITSRLSVLAENNRRLTKQEALLPPVGGNDEIAELDGGFRSMASALIEAIKKEQLMMDRMPAGLVLLDADGNVLQVNERAANLFDYEPQDLKGRNVESFFSGSVSDGIDVLGLLKQQVTGRTLTGPILCRTGETKNVELSLDEITLKDARGYLLILLDVTEKFELQKIKQQLVAMIAHDAATPLTALIMSLEMFRDGKYGPLTEGGVRKVEMLQREAKRILKLWQDLISVEKYGVTSFSIELERIGLADLIEQSVSAVQTKAQQVGVRIAIEAFEPVKLSVDRDRMIQVFVNILSNAVKFSPAESQITVSVEQTTQQVEIKIADTGCGIPEAMMTRIFEPFKQSQTSDATVKGGSGLGLAICRSIVESHRGSMSVTNNRDGGATFSITLPLTADGESVSK